MRAHTSNTFAFDVDASFATVFPVNYSRTSLAPAADDAVLAMGREDTAAGPEWSAQIGAYLATTRVDR